MWSQEKNQPRIGANRKSEICSPLRVFDPRLNPPFGRGESDLLILTLARRVFQPRRLVPSSGPFGQILSVPRHLLKEIFREYFNEKEGEKLLSGAAGAATGFARTIPMRDEQDSEAVLRK
ncbi:hypothetical protein ASJ83_01710 [Methanocorpusculum parvum]|uniref:Uncharacterized protein n=1 Tax=Methanocorpusculum parvum TaxID=2193 RepID=A0AAX0Q7V3_9EURY|nr:hypothetical protein ASJ83_01710 [Methanocorpusculum parvum]